MTSARAFIAFEIPGDVAKAIAKTRGPLERRLPPARWVRPENLHLTLLFLGDLSLSILELLMRAMRREFEGVHPPKIVLGGAGFFPDVRRARVAWIGGEAPGVGSVLRGVDRASEEAGLRGGSQPWSLHLTQARLKRSWPPASVRGFTRWADGLEPAPFDAREVVVFTSEFRLGRPVYTAFGRIGLT